MSEVFVLLLNQGSGSTGDDAVRAVRRAVEEAGLDHRVVDVAGDPEGAARRAVADGATVLVACGGDGSVGAVAGVAAEAGCALAVLPMGTLNHFAKDLGLPADPVDAVAVLSSGVRRDVDLGCVGDTVFVNNAGVGSYARLVARREQLEDRIGKWRAALAALRSVFPHRPMPVEIVVDGEPIVTDATIVFFGNNEYVVEGGRFTRERLDGGVVSVYALRAPRVWDVLRIGFRIMRDRIDREHDAVHRTGQRVTLSVPGERVLLSHDGEVTTVSAPLEVTVRPRALAVIVPAEEPDPS